MTLTPTGSQAPAADVLVIFGITGDLAKVMTFRSLYQLEARGLLDCPIVGVAADDWTLDQLVERARTSIEGTGDHHRQDRLRPLRGPAVVRRWRLHRRVRLRACRPGDQGCRDTGLLSRDPAVPVRPGGAGAVRGRADNGCPGRGREAVRPRPAVGSRPGRPTAPVPRRVAAVPDRPLPREDGAGGDPVPAVRERRPRTAVEPQLPGLRPDHHGGELRRRGPRPLLRPGRRAARRGRQPPDAGGRGGRDGTTVARRSGHAEGLAGRLVPRDRGGRSGPLRPRPVRRLPRHRRGREGLHHRDVRRAPARHRELALGRCAVLHPHRETAAGDPDRAPAGLQTAAAAGLRTPRAHRRAEPAGDQARPDDRGPDPGGRAPRGHGPDRADRAGHGVRAPRAARAPRRTRCCCTRR